MADSVYGFDTIPSGSDGQHLLLLEDGHARRFRHPGANDIKLFTVVITSLSASPQGPVL